MPLVYREPNDWCLHPDHTQRGRPQELLSLKWGRKISAKSWTGNGGQGNSACRYLWRLFRNYHYWEKEKKRQEVRACVRNHHRSNKSVKTIGCCFVSFSFVNHDCANQGRCAWRPWLLLLCLGRRPVPFESLIVSRYSSLAPLTFVVEADKIPLAVRCDCSIAAKAMESGTTFRWDNICLTLLFC